jgi:hypothetical protein
MGLVLVWVLTGRGFVSSRFPRPIAGFYLPPPERWLIGEFIPGSAFRENWVA